MFFFTVWWIVCILQMLFSYGTAYRLTRDGGDSGVALFVWMILMMVASLIPGLGFYLWNKYRDGNDSTSSTYIYRKKPKFVSEANEQQIEKKQGWTNPCDAE